MSYKVCIVGFFLFEVDINFILFCDWYELFGCLGVGVLDFNIKLGLFFFFVVFILLLFIIFFMVI